MKPEVELYYHEEFDIMVIKTKNKLYKYLGDFRNKKLDEMRLQVAPNIKFNEWYEATYFCPDFKKVGEL